MVTVSSNKFKKHYDELKKLLTEIDPSSFIKITSDDNPEKIDMVLVSGKLFAEFEELLGLALSMECDGICEHCEQEEECLGGPPAGKFNAKIIDCDHNCEKCDLRAVCRLI